MKRIKYLRKCSKHSGDFNKCKYIYIADSELPICRTGHYGAVTCFHAVLPPKCQGSFFVLTRVNTFMGVALTALCI